MNATKQGSPPVCAGPQKADRKPTITFPPGAADCHAHVFGPPEAYPHAATRAYTPPPVYLADYIGMLDALGIQRGVLVQSGVHGTDNSVVVDAIARFPDRLRGVALLDPSISKAELERLHRGGIRGFRSNLVAKTGVQFEAARQLAERVKDLGWHVQFLMDVEGFPDLERTFESFPTEVVIDHMGRPDPEVGTSGPGFQALLRLLQTGRAWSKLSAPYRTSRMHPPYPDMAPFARALVEAAPEQLVWGTDWPHVMLDTPMPHDADLADMLASWVPKPETREQILLRNPARLYRFDEVSPASPRTP